MSEPAVELRGVTLRRREETVLERVDLLIGRDEYMAVLGPNGSGKTSLLLVILGLLEPQAGTVRVFGAPPREARGRIGYVPQHARFDRDFPIRVLDVALMGRLGLRPPGRPFSAHDREVAHVMLERMGVERLAPRPIGALSGGELQRVLIARALTSEPKLLLLDEPAAGLDERIGTSLWEQLEALSREMAVVLVSHDIGAISAHVQRVACLNRSLFVHDAHELTPEVLEKIYGAPVTLLAHHDSSKGDPR